MSKLLVAGGVGALAATGAALLMQSQANHALRSEMAGLREEVRLATLAAQSAATRSPAGARSSAPTAVAVAAPASEDLAKLREEIAALHKSTTTLTQYVQVAQAAQALAKTSEVVATKLTPASQFRNAGKATPEATTETALWAAVGGDVEALAGALTFTASSKAKADAWFAGLSEATQQQYGTPEKVIALMVARDAETLSGMQVLGQKELGPDDVGVRIRVASNEGKTKDDTFLMHRTPDGWKLVLPDNAVEKFARQLRGGK